MNLALLPSLVANEVRLRLRRLSSAVALLAMIALAWAMIGDPASGTVLLVVNDARVLYTSSALALASASLASPLFALLGFFLLRGRMAEDVRSGIGSVIGASAIGNWQFLLSRWLGGVAYLLSLILVFMLSMMVCQILRGDGAVDVVIYLQTYALVLLPNVLFAVSCAVLFDSFAPAMGKVGDILYFFIWVAQLALVAQIDEAYKSGMPTALLFDFSGIATTMFNFTQHLHTENISLGGGTFDAKLAPLTLPAMLWSSQLIGMRLWSALLALLPILPAAFIFHRFSPDKVKASRSRQRRTPWQVLNNLLRPLASLAQPLMRLAQNLPGIAGQIVADVSLTLISAPSAIAAILLINLAALLVPSKDLAGLLSLAVAIWAVVISDIATRDFQAQSEEMTAALPGGNQQRYLRQLAASLLLGLFFMGTIALRCGMQDVQHVLAIVSGMVFLAAVAHLLGRTSGSARTFLSLFMLAMYIALNASKVPMLDAIGFNGVANTSSILMYGGLGLGAVVAGYVYNMRRGR